MHWRPASEHDEARRPAGLPPPRPQASWTEAERFLHSGTEAAAAEGGGGRWMRLAATCGRSEAAAGSAVADGEGGVDGDDGGAADAGGDGDGADVEMAEAGWAEAAAAGEDAAAGAAEVQSASEWAEIEAAEAALASGTGDGTADGSDGVDGGEGGARGSGVGDEATASGNGRVGKRRALREGNGRRQRARRTTGQGRGDEAPV